jgi:hypothetical protein
VELSGGDALSPFRGKPQSAQEEFDFEFRRLVDPSEYSTMQWVENGPNLVMSTRT